MIYNATQGAEIMFCRLCAFTTALTPACCMQWSGFFAAERGMFHSTPHVKHPSHPPQVFPSATALFFLAKHSPVSAAVAVRSLPTDCKALISTSAPVRKEEQQGAGSEPGHPSPQEQAQEMSKAFLTSVLDMEELWIKGLAGQLRYWNAAKKMPLQASACTVPAGRLSVVVVCCCCCCCCCLLHCLLC